VSCIGNKKKKKKKRSFLDAFKIMSESLGIKWLLGFFVVGFLFPFDRILSETFLTELLEIGFLPGHQLLFVCFFSREQKRKPCRKK